MLGFPFSVRACFSCSAQTSHCRDCSSFSCCIACALGERASVAAIRRLGSVVVYVWGEGGGLVALQHVGSSRTQIRTVSPALAGRFLTNGPPGKSPLTLSELQFLLNKRNNNTYHVGCRLRNELHSSSSFYKQGSEVQRGEIMPKFTRYAEVQPNSSVFKAQRSSKLCPQKGPGNMLSVRL